MRVVPPLTGHLDMALSNYQKGYRQVGLVGDALFPRLPVSRAVDRYWIYGRENQMLTENTLRAFGTSPQETRFSLSTGSYAVKSRALKSTIPDEDRDLYTTGDLTTDAVSLNMDKILLDREVRIAALATTAANYASTNTLALSAGSQWDDYVNSSPMLPIEVAKKQIRLTGTRCNIAILADDVATALSNHPLLIERFKYTVQTGALDAAQLASVLKVDQVLIASGIQVNPTTLVPDFIWKNCAIFAHVEPSVGVAGVLTGQEGSIGAKQISFGKSFTWVNAPQTIGGYGTIVARHPDALAKSDVVGVDWYSDEQITAADAGFLFTNVLGTP